MRISTNMTSTDFINNLETATDRVQKTMNQLSSLKEYNKSSDNPLAVSKIMDLNVSLAENKSYATTISDATSWVQTQDSALQSVSTTLNSIRSIIVSANSSGSLTQDEYNAYKTQLSQNIGTIIDVLNTSFDGRYIFGGSATTTKPFSAITDNDGNIVSLQYNGNTSELDREISNGVSVTLPTNGMRVMKDGDGNNLGTFFTELMNDLEQAGTSADSVSEDLSKKLDQIDSLKNNAVNYDTKVGAIENRLKAAKDRNSTEKTTLKDTLSTRQDVDVAEKYMEYQNQMLSYKAALAMGTKIMQTTVLDYM